MKGVSKPAHFGSIGGRQIPFDDLVAAWSERVAAVARQAAGDPLAPDMTVHDLVGAYYLRNAIESARIETDCPSLYTVDAELREITEADPYGYGIRIADDDNPTSPWWWMRIPRSGPIRDEIERIRHNRRLESRAEG